MFERPRGIQDHAQSATLGVLIYVNSCGDIKNLDCHDCHYLLVSTFLGLIKASNVGYSNPNSTSLANHSKYFMCLGHHGYPAVLQLGKGQLLTFPMYSYL